MCTRPTFSLVLLVALASGATAQATLTPQRVPGATRHAGIYHVATGTWTRTGGTAAAAGPDIIYSNTAPSGYFSSAGGAGGFAPGSEVYDEGGLPGTTNGHAFAGTPDRDSYTVNGFQIGYCDEGAPGSSGWEINFFSSFDYCMADPSPDESILVTGLPAAGGCWTIDIDLAGGGEFCLEADGGPDNPGWDNDPDLDTFAWSFHYAGTDGAPGNDAGFLLSGNPAVTDPGHVLSGLPLAGSNTYFGTTLCPGTGTGYLAEDLFLLEDPSGTYSNCYFFGGYRNSNGLCSGPITPMGAWYMQIVADTSPCDPQCICGPYCMSNPNSTGVNGTIEGFGSTVAADDDVRLEASVLPPNSFGFFLVSSTQGFVANPNGSQGNLCVLGNIGRFVAPGQIKDSGPTGVITLDTNLGEWTLTALPSATGPYAATTGVTSNFQLWHRDLVNGVPTNNFTDAITVTWL